VRGDTRYLRSSHTARQGRARVSARISCADSTSAGFLQKSRSVFSTAVCCRHSTKQATLHASLRAFPGKTWGNGLHATHAPPHALNTRADAPRPCQDVACSPTKPGYWYAVSRLSYVKLRACCCRCRCRCRCCALVVPLDLQFQTAGYDAKAPGTLCGSSSDLYANLVCLLLGTVARPMAWSRWTTDALIIVLSWLVLLQLQILVLLPRPHLQHQHRHCHCHCHCHCHRRRHGHQHQLDTRHLFERTFLMATYGQHCVRQADFHRLPNVSH
jgi:hypothetical protein